MVFFLKTFILMILTLQVNAKNEQKYIDVMIDLDRVLIYSVHEEKPSWQTKSNDPVEELERETLYRVVQDDEIDREKKKVTEEEVKKAIKTYHNAKEFAALPPLEREKVLDWAREDVALANIEKKNKQDLAARIAKLKKEGGKKEQENKSGSRYGDGVGVVEAAGRKWKIAEGAAELIQSLENLPAEMGIKDRTIRISFFSARMDAEERNKGVIKQITLPNGQRAYEFAGKRVFHSRDMEYEYGDRIKDLSKVLDGFDPKWAALLDDSPKYIPQAHRDSHIWIHYNDRNKKLAIARGVLSKAAEKIKAGKNRTITLEDALKKTLWSGDGKKRKYVNAEKKPEILKAGIEAFKQVNPKYKAPKKADMEREEFIVKKPQDGIKDAIERWDGRKTARSQKRTPYSWETGYSGGGYGSSPYYDPRNDTPSYLSSRSSSSSYRDDAPPSEKEEAKPVEDKKEKHQKKAETKEEETPPPKKSKRQEVSYGGGTSYRSSSIDNWRYGGTYRDEEPPPPPKPRKPEPKTGFWAGCVRFFGSVITN